jgi:predicted nucleic acid-binding Zn ribbon protein
VTRGRRELRGLDSLVPRVLSDLGLGDATAIMRIVEAWEMAVGAEVARHCRPTAVRGGVLEATVDSSVWCQQLQLRRPEILSALRGALGDAAPAELWLRVGPG